MHEWLFKKGLPSSAALSRVTALELNTWLIEAAQQGELQVVHGLIQAGATLSFQDIAGYTALSAVVDAEEENVELVEFLVALGAGLHHRHRDGNTLLHCAVLRGYLKIADFLLHHRVDVTLVNTEGATALHCAAQYGYVDCVKLLLEWGAHPNAKDAKGCTPLHAAAYAGHTETVALLKSLGARDWIINQQRYSALDLAQQQRHAETAAVLGVGTPVTLAECYTEVASHVQAALRQRPFGRQVFIRSGVNTAIESGNLQLLCTLISEGAMIAADALHIATVSGHLKMVIALVLVKVVINAVDENGKMPLHLAAQYGHYDIADFLTSRAEFSF